MNRILQKPDNKSTPPKNGLKTWDQSIINQLAKNNPNLLAQYFPSLDQKGIKKSICLHPHDGRPYEHIELAPNMTNSICPLGVPDQLLIREQRKHSGGRRKYSLGEHYPDQVMRMRSGKFTGADLVTLADAHLSQAGVILLPGNEGQLLIRRGAIRGNDVYAHRTEDIAGIALDRIREEYNHLLDLFDNL
jgi:hypothetical protein